MNKDDLLKFKMVQKIAYEAALYTKNHLEVGMSEKDACELMKHYLKDEGVVDFFHLPFAWFGERSCFKNFSHPLRLKVQKKFFVHRENIRFYTLDLTLHYGRDNKI